MKLEEKHKEYAIKCFAQFIARTEVVDITPQNMKALEDTQKALTEQLEKVTQQLAENTGTTNGSHNP